MTQSSRPRYAREESAYNKPRGFERGAREESAYNKPIGFERDPKPYSSRDDGQSQRPSRFGSTAPETLPYTTAASEFLYGYQTVMAALKAGRRRLYKLYIHERGQNHEGASALIARAKIANVKIQEVDDDYLRLMDKASSGRPHNVSTTHHHKHTT
jgi:21S rRNA (GM2251-2'-O)-methyltransferase